MSQGAQGLPPPPNERPAPVAAVPVKLVELNKEALGVPPVKLRPFGWKRIILDRSKEGKGQVAKENLKGLDPKWEGKEVIWKDMDEYKSITFAAVQDNFAEKKKKKAITKRRLHNYIL